MSQIDDFLSDKPSKPQAGGQSNIDSFLSDAPPKKATAGDRIKDAGLSLAKGVVAVPEAAVGIADIFTGGRVGKALENEGGAIGFRPRQAKEFLSGFQSDAYKDEQRRFSEAEGIVDKAAVAVTNPALVGNTVAESLPSMFAGGALARGAGKAAGVGQAAMAGNTGRALAAGGEGAMMAGMQASEIRGETDDGLLTPKQSALAAGTGVVGGAIGFGGAQLAKRLGIGDVDQMIASGLATGTAKPGLGMLNRAGRGALTEGVFEELPQSLTETAFQNIALDRPVTQGMDEAAVLGTLAGGVMGAGGGVVSGFGQPRAKTDAPPVVPPAPATPPVQPQEDSPVVPEVAPLGAPLTGTGAGMLGAPVDPLRSVIRPSQAMGLNPAAGPLSAAAATAVDSGASPVVQSSVTTAPPAAVRQADQQPAPDLATRSTEELRTALRNAQDPAIRKTVAAELAKRKKEEAAAMPDPLQPSLIDQPQGEPAREPSPPQAVQASQEEPQAPAAQPELKKPRGILAKKAERDAKKGKPNVSQPVDGLRPDAGASTGAGSPDAGAGMGTDLGAVRGRGNDAADAQPAVQGDAGQRPAVSAADPAALRPTNFTGQPSARMGQMTRATAGPGFTASDVTRNVQDAPQGAAAQAEAAPAQAPEAARDGAGVQQGGVSEFDAFKADVVKSFRRLQAAPIQYNPKRGIGKQTAKKVEDSDIASKMRRLGFRVSGMSPDMPTDAQIKAAFDRATAPVAGQAQADGVTQQAEPAKKPRSIVAKAAEKRAAEVAEKTASEWSDEMQRLRDVKPRPLAKTFGTNGPTPEQKAAYDEKVKRWNAQYRRASENQKIALANENKAREAAAAAIKEAAHEAATSPKNDLPQPTEAQKEAGNYQKGHITINGLDISIENPAGSRRRPEWPPLKHHYGYFKGSVGADKDHVDVFLTDKAGDASLPVFIVDQVNKEGSFDEHKVVMGTATEEEARAAYLANYEKGWTGLGAITQMPLEDFKAWVMDPAKTAKRSDVAQPQKAQERFEAGKALTKEQRKAVLNTLTDVYKVKGADREMKGIDQNGNERYGYVHSPDLFEKSDITGAMVRYYVTLPDGRKAHPTELFPDYTQSDIDAEMQARESRLRGMKSDAARMTVPAQQFSTIAEAVKWWDERSAKSTKTASGLPTIFPSEERRPLTDGKKFILIPNTTSGEMLEVLADDGWKIARAPQAQPQQPTAPKAEDGGGEAAQAAEFNAQAAWDRMTPAARAAMLDKWAGAGQTDMGERYKDRAWGSFNPGEKSTLSALLESKRPLSQRSVDWLRKNGGETISVTEAIDALSSKSQQITDNKENWTPRGDDGRPLNGIHLYTPEARKKLDDIGWAINNLQQHRKREGEGPRTAPNAKPQGEAASLSSVIDKVNAKNGEGLTEADRVPEAKPASKTPTIDRHEAVMQAVRDGKATAEQFKASFEEVVANKAAIIAELGTKTKAQLLSEMNGWHRQRYANENKSEIVDALYRDMVGDYVLGESLSYGMGKGAFEAAVRARVEATDDDKLAKYRAEREAAIAEAMEARKARAAALENPQTLNDYRSLLNEKIREGQTRKEAFLSLTPEQRIRYDELEAEATKDARETRKRMVKTEVRAAGQTTGGEIIATKHTKTGADLFVVQLADRLSKEDYTTVLASAKRMGGWYSSFRGNGAVPGFQFKTRDAADAFLKLAGGDTTAAAEQAQQRRDAFEDDRSQTAVERLREMAEKIEDRAAEDLSRERKTNTARRARFAASAERAAESEKALARTMRNIAQAIEDGKAKFLDGVRMKTQVESLTGYVNTAKSNELRAKYPTYAEQEKRRGEPPTAETADFAEFPAFTSYRSDLASLARQMLEVDGTKKLGQQLMKVADDVTDAYIDFAKENIGKVSQFMRGGDMAVFASRDTAEQAIKRSGLTGKAIVLPVKRGDNRVILSPSEAINRGIWTGDGDKRITLTKEFGNELVEAIGRRGNKQNNLTVPWQLQTAYDRRKALSRMGIETPSEFRSALREFIALQERATANKVREMELAMVGRKSDGLDFFPTPAEVADQMVDAADIKPDMAVLEPSAGMGHIADRIRAAGAEPDVIEISGDRRELLLEKGYNTQDVSDFLDLKPREFFTFGDVFRAPDGTEGIMRGAGSMGSDRVRLVNEAGDMVGAGYYNRSELTGLRHRGSDSGYDRIVMNPPFSNRRDAEHVMHAYSLLKPGGRVVAIMGEGVFFGQDKKAQEFRDWLESVNGTSEKLPEGSFMDPSLPVNTGVNARMVVIDKPEGDVQFSIADEAPPFYSALAREIEALPTKSAPVIGWQAALQGLVKNGKVKADELEWTGITDWLKLQTGKVSKEDVTAYLGANGVQVTETVLGGAEVTRGQARQSAIDAFAAEGYELEFDPIDDDGAIFTDPDGEPVDYDDLPESLQAVIDTASDAEDRANVNQTKYENYTLPGGSNYREVLLTLPDSRKAADGWKFVQVKDLGPVQSWDRGNEEKWAAIDPNGDRTATFDTEAAARSYAAKHGQPDKRYKSSHWDQPNVLAHIRVNDRVDADGKRVLFVEELQSDWGQDGKKKGFVQPMTPAKEARIAELESEVKAISDSWGGLPALLRASKEDPEAQTARAKQAELRAEIASIQESAGIVPTGGVKNGLALPAAPFVDKTDKWLALSLKRILKMAVDGGYDRVAFVNGEQSADRYDLSKQISEINYEPAGEGRYEINAKDMNGKTVLDEDEVTLARIEELVGKEIAKKIEAGEGEKSEGGYRDWHKLSGLDLKVGGEGMKSFYDKIVPAAVKDVLKKVGGGQMESVGIEQPNKNSNQYLGDQPFDPDRAELRNPGPGVWQVWADGKLRGNGNFDSEAAARAFIKTGGRGSVSPQPGFTITPQMRQKVAGGLPLFRMADQTQIDANLSEQHATPSGPHAQAVKAFADRLSQQRERPVQMQAVSPGTGEQGKKARTLAGIARKMFNRDVVFVRFTNGDPLFNGAVSSYAPGKVFINIDSPRPMMAVLGHELLHEFRKNDEGAYQSLIQRLDALLADSSHPIYAAILAEKYRKAGMKSLPRDIREELYADIVGDHFTEAEFWQALTGASTDKPLVWKRVLNKVMEWLQSIGNKLRRIKSTNDGDVMLTVAQQADGNRPFGTDKFITDLEASRQAVLEAFRTFDEQAKGGDAMSVAGDNGRMLQQKTSSTAVAKLNEVMRSAGWEVEYIDLDLTGEKPKAAIRVKRDDGRFLIAKVDSVGRASFETFQRERSLRMDGSTKGRRPLSPMVDDTFLGRQKFEGARSMLRGMVNYLVDNASSPVALADMKSAWAGAMAAPVQQEIKAIAAPDTGGASLSVASKADQTETPEFKRWFGDSKVVDAQGKPLVVYHGTTGNFSEFMPSDMGEFGGGIYFTPDTRGASDYAIYKRMGAATVMPAYVSIKNPASAQEASQVVSWHGEESAKAELIRRGYDGVIDMRSGQIVAFRPKQIKSAIGNVGTFDPENPDIRFSIADASDKMAEVMPQKVMDLYSDATSSQRGFNRWWHKTVGTQLHKAKINKDYGRVFYAVQDFMHDVSRMATIAAGKAPTLLTQIESMSDVGKAIPLLANPKRMKERKTAIKQASDALFDGTLRYTRDASGKVVEAMDAQDGGLIWTDAELKDRGLSEQAITMYREGRAAIDQSLDSMLAADIYRAVTTMNPEMLVSTPSEWTEFTDRMRKLAASEKPDDAVKAALSAMKERAKEFEAEVDQLLEMAAKADGEEATFLFAAMEDPQRKLEAVREEIKKATDKRDRIGQLKKAGYAPLMRFGEYTVSAFDDMGQRVFFGMYESQFAANRAARKFQEQGLKTDQGVMSKKEFEQLKGLSPETAMLFAEMLGVEKNEAMQQWLRNAVAEQSALKRHIRRKGVEGFDDDSARVVAAFLTSNSRAASRALHSYRIEEAVANVKQGDVKDEAITLADYVNNPKEEAQAVRSLLFVNYIGGSVSSAMVNLTQTFVQTFPFLSQYGGAMKAGQRLGDAMKIALLKKVNDPELEKAIKQAELDDVIKPQEVFQLQAEASRTLGSNLYARTGLAVWGSFFQLAEQFNRRVAFIAAYQTARQEKISDPFAFAKNAVDETQGIFNKGNRPNWGRGAIGATLFTFKTFTIQYVEFLKRMPPKQRAIGLAVLFLMAGAGGFPFAEDAEDVIDTVAQAMGYNFTSKSARDEFLRRTLGDGWATFLQSGVSPWTPFDVAQRLGMADLLPGTSILKKSETRKEDQALEIFGVAGSFVRDALKGEVRPIAFRNAAKAIEMYNMGIYRDTRGRKVMEVDPLDAVFKSIGLQPSKVASESRKIGIQYEKRALYEKVRNEITEQMALGQFERDPEKVEKAREAVKRWNEKNPEAPLFINMQNVWRRVREMNTDRTARFLKSTPKELRGEIAKVIQ